MKIVYLRQTFPQNSETFLMEEVRCLLAAGHEVRVVTNGIDVAGLHPRVLEHRLLDHVAVTPVPSAEIWRLAARVALRPPYRRRYLVDWYPARPKLTRLRETLTEGGLGRLWRGVVQSARFHNLSLGLEHPQRAEMFRPDVIHVPFLFPWEAQTLEAMRRAWTAIPYTITLRAAELHRRDQRPERVALQARLIQDAARLITISQFNRDLLLSDARPLMRAASRHAQPIAVIHSAIDTTFFRRTVATPRTADIVSVGRLVPKKGLHLLIEACRILHDRGRGVTCRIIGDGSERPRLARLIAADGLGDFVTLAPRATQVEVRSALAGASVFVLPCVVAEDGDRDVLPNGLKEAMAMELPVVTSDLSGIQELVVDGHNGLLVPAGEAEVLADRIATLLDDDALRERLGRAARATVVSDFDCVRETRKLGALLESTQ